MHQSSADTYRTKLSVEQLGSIANTLGFDVTDSAALMCAAMVADPEFRERVSRANFEKVLRDLPRVVDTDPPLIQKLRKAVRAGELR